MANYRLGPVIGKIGGGVEIVEQQIVESGTVTLPDGWSRAWVLAQARTDAEGEIRGGGRLFGWQIPMNGASFHRVALLEPGGSLSVQVGLTFGSGNALVDITMIRID